MVADVSVVMPIGGIDDYLPIQLDALAAQETTLEWELVVSLNLSDPGDRSAVTEVLERSKISELADLRVKVVDSSDIRSAAHARNVGAANSSAPLLAFCDADDIAEPDWLDNIVSALEHDPAIGGYLDEESLAIPKQDGWRPPATPGGNPSFLGFPFLVSANMGIRRQVFEEIGGFDTSLSRCEDIAFGWDITRLGYTIGFAPNASMKYRHRSGLWPMVHQHYLYGVGMSEVLARHGVPSIDGTTPSLFASNSQSVEKKGSVYFLRRSAIAAGRLVGLIKESSVSGLWKTQKRTPTVGNG